MSAQFILEYGGMPMTFTSAGAQPVRENLADKFIAEQDAWFAARQAGLNPTLCRVVNLYLRNNQPANPSRL